MRILDESSDKPLNNIILYLTKTEASELLDSLNEIIKKPSNNHTHISGENYQKELTVCIYDTQDLNGFDDRSKKLIINDI